MGNKVDYLDIGLKEYKKAWDIQEDIHSKLVSNKNKGGTPDTIGTLIFCEHPHVYTLGKSGQRNNLLINEEFLTKINATYFQSNRGGDITYHGPGQLVGYPVFDIDTMGLGVKAYVHKLEECVIAFLKEYGIDSTSLDGATGVWLDADKPTARKICAIGVRVSKAITMHGFALNINTDLTYFNHINPCGFVDKGVTSMQKELGKKFDISHIKQELKGVFKAVFDLEYFES